jgi:nucleotide-binding universal stress UspA family protein
MREVSPCAVIGQMRKDLKGERMISKILVPTDGSKAAQKAARFAVDLAKQLKASIIALSVFDRSSFIGSASSDAFVAPRELESIESSLQEDAKKHGESVKKLCDKHGIQSKTIFTTGHPVEDIVREAKRSKADLIVMGSHGRSALTAAILGSVAYGVIHRDIKTPVLVVKR